MNSLPEKNEQYNDVGYWDNRYEKEELYEWCKGYESFKTLIGENVINKDSRILILGCGNSNLAADMYKDGFQNITNLDYSQVVIEKMSSKFQSTHPSIKWDVGDMRNLSDSYPPDSFDIVIEKGTLDVLLTSEKSQWTTSPEAQEDMDKTLRGIKSILNPNGKFLSITFAQPHFRRKFYEQFWQIKIQTFGDTFHYYFYVCQGDPPSHVKSE